MLTPEERQAILAQVTRARKRVDDPWAYAYSTDVPLLLNEVERLQPHNLVGQVDELLKLGVEMRREFERLTTENTYHSLQLDRSREEIERLREALKWYGMQMTYEYIKDESAPIPDDRGERARQALAGEPKGQCTCAKSNWDSLRCPQHGLDSKQTKEETV